MKPYLLTSRGTLPLLAAVTFLGFLDTHLLLPVMSLYAADLGAGLGVAGLIIGLYSITNTPANIFFGRLIDRFGAKVPLIAGLVADALGMFLYAFCRLPVHLALVRMLHGTSGGLVGPATMSLTAAQTSPGRQARTMGTYGMALAAATLVGYGVGGVIVARLGYQVLFFFGAGLLLVGAVLSCFIPGSRPAGHLSDSPASGSTGIKTLLRRRGLLAAYGAIFAQYFTFGGVITLLPLYLKGQGMTAMHVGILLAVFAVMFIAFQFPGGSFSDRHGRRIPALFGLGLGTAALAALGVLHSLPLLAAAMALYGTGYGLLFPAISAVVVDNTGPGERGTATGIFHALITSGVAVGAPVIGWVGELFGIGAGLFLTAAVMALALVVTAVLLPRRAA